MSTEPPFTTSDNSGKEDPRVAQLIREATAAIKLGDKVSARTKLQEAVAIDQYSEQGWYWLAAVVDTDAERKVCLGNVVVINPNNKRAQDMLDKLSGNLNAGLMTRDSEPALGENPLLEGEAIEGMSRNRKMLLIGGGIAAVVLVLVLVMSLLGGSHPPPLPTVVSTTDLTAGPSKAAVAAGLTKSPTFTPTINLTPSATLPAVAPTLPPTWTAQPSATVGGQMGTALPTPPPGLTGQMTAISGSMITAKGNLPVFLLDPTTGKLRQVTSDVGDNAVLTADGSRLIFSRYIPSTDAQQLRIMNSNGTQPTELSRLWGNLPPLADVKQPSLALNGKLLAFSASSLTENDATADIWAIPATAMNTLVTGSDSSSSLPEPDTATVPPTTAPATDVAPTVGAGTKAPTKAPTVAPTVAPTASGPTATAAPLAQVRRITPKESGINTWPAVSPDGSTIVYVNDGQPLGSDSIDIYAVSASGGKTRNLTNDNMDLVESAPEFSPDGSKIAYHAAPKGAKTNDIYVMDADGSNKVKLTDGPGDNIRPHWSPDGKYLAFSSTRSGKWEVYILALDTKTIYQLTETQGSTICTGWSAK